MDLPKLTSDDVAALVALREWVAATEIEERRELRRREEGLPEAAREWWQFAPSDRLTAELARWRPAYRIERTEAGYRVRRYIASGRRYASRPQRTGLTAGQVERYRYWVRV